MRFLEVSDAASFLHISRHLLLKSEAENNLLLSSALTLARTTSGRSSRLAYYVIEREGKIICAALHVVNRRLLLASAEPEAARFLGSELVARGIRVRGVFAPSPVAAAATEALNEDRSASLHATLKQNVLKLEVLRAHEPSTGFARAAREKDFRRLLNWSTQFVHECRLDESIDETEEVVRRYLDHGQLFVWEDGHPVAMAGFGGPTPGGIRVNMVYTDPAARSRGYATSLVHMLSRKLLGPLGHKSCVLFVDAHDPIANRVYEKLGYQPISTFAEFRATPDPKSKSPENDPTAKAVFR